MRFPSRKNSFSTPFSPKKGGTPQKTRYQQTHDKQCHEHIHPSIIHKIGIRRPQRHITHFLPPGHKFTTMYSTILKMMKHTTSTKTRLGRTSIDGGITCSLHCSRFRFFMPFNLDAFITQVHLGLAAERHCVQLSKLPRRFFSTYHTLRHFLSPIFFATASIQRAG